MTIQPLDLPRDSPATAPEPQEVRRPNEADTALIRQMTAGNEGALARFYDRFAPGLFAMIYAILNDQKASEDVLQDAFVQMWKRAATYDAARSSLFTWAVMIARHKAIDRLRSRQRQAPLSKAVAADSDIHFVSVADDHADNALAMTGERARVRAALNQLDEAQREAIYLAFFSGLTDLQIAERLGAPLATVKARIRCGLLALRELLGGMSL